MIPSKLQSLKLKEALSPMIMASRKFTLSLNKRKRSREVNLIAVAEVVTVIAVPALMTTRAITIDHASKEVEAVATGRTSARRVPISTTIMAKSNKLISNSIINSPKEAEEAVEQGINNAKMTNTTVMTINTRKITTTKSKEE